MFLKWHITLHLHDAKCWSSTNSASSNLSKNSEGIGKSLDKWGIVCMYADRRADINIILCALDKQTEIQKCAYSISNLYCQKITKKIWIILCHLATQVRELSLQCALFSEDKQSDARICHVSTSTFLRRQVQPSQAGTANNPHHTWDSLWLLLGWRERGNGHQTVMRKP